MSNWKTYKLGDIVSKLGDGLHGTPKYDENGNYYFVNGSNLINGNIEISQTTKRVNEQEYIKHKKELNDRTVLLGINGTIGNVALYSNEKCILGKSVAYINVDEKFDKHFIKYILINDDFQNYIRTNATGTTIKNVGLGLLRQYEVSIPESLEEQKKIASILSSLDDKIELNRQMNQTLEAVAQGIFKEWFLGFNYPGFDGEFVEGLPKGWKKGKLGEILELLYGKALKAEVRGVGPYPVVGSSGIVDYHNDYLVEAPGIVIGRKGTIGEVIWMEENFFPIDTTFFVKDVLGANGLYYHYFLLKEQDFKKIASDSAVPGLNRNQAMDNIVVVPNIDIVNSFNLLVQPIFEKKEYNLKQNASLIQIRESLLPKLMSGKITIQN